MSSRSVWTYSLQTPRGARVLECGWCRQTVLVGFGPIWPPPLLLAVPSKIERHAPHGLGQSYSVHAGHPSSCYTTIRELRWGKGRKTRAERRSRAAEGPQTSATSHCHQLSPDRDLTRRAVPRGCSLLSPCSHVYSESGPKP